jgi:ubiquinone/menaquinone biosynthesis C-methylase UbiE
MQYDAPAAYAELIAPRYAPIADALVEAAALRANDDVLELGAGTGLVTKRVAPRVRSLVATDLSAGMLAAGRESVRRAPGRSFALVDYGAPLPFLDRSFDLVLSGLTYAQNARETVNEIVRVLKPNGRLALESIGRGRFPSPAPGRALRRLERAGFRRVSRSDLDLVTRFASVDDYLAYRRGFGVPLGWTRATYERFLRAVRREASAYADGDGRFALGWTVTIVTARRA